MLKLYVADIALISSQQVFDNFMSKMNEQRRAKVLRCKNEKDKYCSLMAGMLLRHALEQEGLEYESLTISVTPEGKPFLASHPEIHFSLSHSGTRAVCLLSEELIGVDVENRNRRLFEDGREEHLTSVAKKVMNQKEFDMFMNVSGKEKEEVFLKAWTRKEAVSKAIGKGIAMDFSQIDEEEEKYLSFWLDEEYYLSIYMEKKIREELDICMMN